MTVLLSNLSGLFGYVLLKSTTFYNEENKNHEGITISLPEIINLRG